MNLCTVACFHSGKSQRDPIHNPRTQAEKYGSSKDPRSRISIQREVAFVDPDEPDKAPSNV